MSDTAGFIAKEWEVTVAGYGCGRQVAATRGRALADTWRCDAFGHLSFKEFLKSARCRRATSSPDFGRPITINGRPAFMIGRDSQYIRFAWPGSDVVLNSHPLDVEPDEVRPPAYRRPTPPQEPNHD